MSEELTKPTENTSVTPSEAPKTVIKTSFEEFLNNPEKLLLDAYNQSLEVKDHVDYIMVYLRQFFADNIDKFEKGDDKTSVKENTEDFLKKKKSFQLLASPTVAKLLDAANSSNKNIIDIFRLIADYKIKTEHLKIERDKVAIFSKSVGEGFNPMGNTLLGGVQEFLGQLAQQTIVSSSAFVKKQENEQ